MTEVKVAGTAWRDLYERRLVSVEEAVSHVKSGDHIYVGTGQRVAKFLTALVARAHASRSSRADSFEGVEIKGSLGGNEVLYGDDLDGPYTVNLMAGGVHGRKALAEGRATFTPFQGFDGHKALDEGRPEGRRVDVNLVCVTPPNESGYVCFGNNLWDAKGTVRRAKLTLALVNDHLPRTFGDTWIHVSEIDYFAEDHTPLTPAPRPEPEPHDRPMAEYIASLINDRDTIQIGVGSVTSKMCGLGVLDNKHDLGMFSELAVAGAIDLVKRGVITSNHMTTHTGRVVLTSGGAAGDIEFINNNPKFEFLPSEYVLNPVNIARNDNVRAINMGIAVDLTGQIGVTSIGPRILNGTGGQLPFALGAFMSKGGRYICGVPSTAAKGTISRIVPQHESGQVITIPREYADTIVTEYGIARLLNKTLRERANELIAVAHPDFRGELRNAANKLFWH